MKILGIILGVLVIIIIFYFKNIINLIPNKKHSSKHASKKDDHAHGDDKSPHGSHGEGHGGHDEHGDHGHHKIGFFQQIWEIILLGVIIIALLSVLFFIGYGIWSFFKKDEPKEKTKKEIVQPMPRTFSKTYNLSEYNKSEKIVIPHGYNFTWESSGEIYYFQTNKTNKVLCGQGNYVDIRHIEVEWVVISFNQKEVTITFTFTKK